MLKGVKYLSPFHSPSQHLQFTIFTVRDHDCFQGRLIPCLELAVSQNLSHSAYRINLRSQPVRHTKRFKGGCYFGTHFKADLLF